jgi:hypothetical protein
MAIPPAICKVNRPGRPPRREPERFEWNRSVSRLNLYMEELLQDGQEDLIACPIISLKG